MAARHVLTVSVMLLAAVACSDEGPGSAGESQSSDSTIPASVQHAGDYFVMTSDYSPPKPDEFIQGVGVTGVVSESPEGCLTSDQPGLPDEGRRLLMLPADSVLGIEGGEPVITVGKFVLRVGNGYEGGRRGPYLDEPVIELFPELAAELPEPCRRLPLAVIDELNYVYEDDCIEYECRD